MQAIVTGSTGFIGSHLVRRLLEQGCNVTALSLKEELPTPHHRNLSFRRWSPGQYEQLSQIVREVSPDIIYHLSSMNLTSHESGQIGEIVSVNILLGTLLAEAASRWSPSACMVTMGSAWEHGNGPAYSPINLYGATKQAQFDIFTYYCHMKSLRHVALKVFHVWGESDSRKRLVTMLCEAALKGHRVKMSGGAQFINLTHVDDVVSGLFSATKWLFSCPAGTQAAWSLLSDEFITVQELVRRIEHLVDRQIDVEWGALPYKDGEFFGPARMPPRLPHWKPAAQFNDSLLRLISSLGNQGALP